VFLNPHDPAVIEEALKQGIPANVIEAAQKSPVYKMAMDWKLALPLHPEYRTLPMVWYVPPLSPIQSYADAGGLPMNDGVLPAVENLRIPVQYREHAQCRRYRPGAARPETHDGDASLQAFSDR
jgi:nitrate reductase beta subunit